MTKGLEPIYFSKHLWKSLILVLPFARRWASRMRWSRLYGIGIHEKLTGD